MKLFKKTHKTSLKRGREGWRVAIKRKPLKSFFDESVMEKKEKHCLRPKNMNFILNLCIPSSNIHDDTVHFA